jgi:phospholipid/cholesterol/gamma-HCH transport system substrate-binding protein
VRRRGAAAAVIALVAGGCALPGAGTDQRTVVAWFPRTVALYRSGDVRVMGLSAGHVSAVEVSGGRVRVTLKVDRDVPLPRDVRAMIVPQSLIGERYVQLYPAWKGGDPTLPEGAEIPLERTSVPVEPDEALAALKTFLDSLDPNATGRLVRNLAADLDGAGGDLNRALAELGRLAGTVAGKHEAIGRIVDELDRFTATLATRERQLGEVLDRFATLAALLAEERRAVEELVRGLGRAATDGLDLVSTHGEELKRDIAVLTRTLQSAVANLDSVRQLLDAGPILTRGLIAAHDPERHRIDLRNAFSPAAQEAASQVLGPLGVPVGPGLCLPVDVACTPPPGAPAATGGARGTAASAGRPTTAPAGRPGAGPAAGAVAEPVTRAPWAERVAAAPAGLGRFLRGAARALLEVAG